MLCDVLDRVNGEVRLAGRLQVARNRIAMALKNLIEACDAFEDRGDETHGAGDLAGRLSDALKPVEGRLVKVRLFPVGRRASTEPRPADGPAGAAHQFRVEQVLMVGQETDEALYLGFAQAMGQLDDLRRLRRCDQCEKFYVRTKVQRQARHFCSDDCRRTFHNIGKRR
jgi:hypothetical protein